MLKIKLLSLSTVLFYSISFTLSAQNYTSTGTLKNVGETDTNSLHLTYNKAMQRLINDPALRYGQVGIVVSDVETGKILAEHNAMMSLIPASNMKIVSTAAGLAILGADFQFQTELQYDGDIRDSVLYGNLVIRGHGDPTLASPLMPSVPNIYTVLDSFTNEIRRLGIKRIVGKVIGDGTVFEKQTATQTWLWEDLGNAYGAGPSGLNIHENYYDLVVQRNLDVGSSPDIVSINPYIPNFQVVNEAKTVASNSDDGVIYAVPYGSTAYLRGTILAGVRKDTINGAMPDPAFFAAWHLRKTLMERGIEVTDSATTQWALEQPGTPRLFRKTFYTWYSPKLSDIVKHANHESVNLYCEAIVRAIGVRQFGIGSNEEGTKAVTHFWQSMGVNIDGLFMQDGSGLSPRNGITPMQLTNILRTVARDSAWFSAFYSSLPTPKTGTLKNMFKNTPSVMGRLRAKSGTITRVKSYSGYVTTQKGQLIAFSAICNNFTCTQREIRKKLEEFMVDICQE